MTIQCTTGLVRLSYVNVFTPRATNEGQDPKYSVTCLLPKSDVNSFNQLMAAITEETNAEINGKLKGINPQYVKHPIHDGDGVDKNGKEYPPECKGHWVFTASCKADRPPQVVDANVQPIINQAEVYSGCYGHVAIAIYAYDNQSKGIGFGLNGVQKVKDGEALGATFNVNDAFKPASDNATVGTTNPVGINPITGQPM